MHELPVTESILNVVLKYAARADVSKIVNIHLRIGQLSDLEDEWMQSYFDYLSKGTLAEGARLVIKRMPIVLQCNSCSHTFEVKKEELSTLQCPQCKEKGCSMISGKEYHIENMEVV